eukprot:TRINITY_DN15307_c0_g1_i1.p1 TRINITY_DN15307_c0_g1~~TRINITY_DN15307_c0_g1_i1.p1  ORF type:complete len:605 (+),score=137.07 TRINITY_DN15307_c0_g1_i1:85-1815(+)
MATTSYVRRSRSLLISPILVFLLLLLLQFSSRFAFVKSGRCLPIRGRWKTSPLSRSALRESDTLMSHEEVIKLKEQLRRVPSKATMEAIEKRWRPTDAIRGPLQLQGNWRLLSPEENGAVGWMTGDLPRILLDLYVGNIGRMLSMKLVAPPRLSIAGNGQTETETHLQWGSQRDKIILHSRLAVVGPNILRMIPQAIRSSSLQLTMPAVQPQRELQVTYYDQDLIILRDGRGIVDALMREKDRGLANHGKESQIQDQRPPEDGNSLEGNKAGEAEVNLASDPVLESASDQMKHLLSEIETLRASLEAQQTRSQADKEARSELSEDVERLEKKLEEATIEARGTSFKLQTISTIQDKASKATEEQTDKTAHEVQEKLALEAEVASLEQRSEELEVLLNRKHLQESSLRSQISILEHELNVGARDAWPAYRNALAKAREELHDVRSELRSTTKEVSQLQNALSKKTVELRRKTQAADQEMSVRQNLEEQLEEQKREMDEASLRLSQALANEEALHAELASMKEKLLKLEKREADGKKMATAVQAEISNVAAQVKETKKVAKSLAESNEKRRFRFWPFR